VAIVAFSIIEKKTFLNPNFCEDVPIAYLICSIGLLRRLAMVKQALIYVRKL